MIIKAIESSMENAPEYLFQAGWTKEAILHITKGKEYEVHAITVFQRRTSFQIVDDLDFESWLPVFLFEVVEGTIPADWICNLVHNDQLLIGPRFIAESYEAYGSMVEHVPEQVWKFEKRLRKMKEDKETS